MKKMYTIFIPIQSNTTSDNIAFVQKACDIVGTITQNTLAARLVAEKYDIEQDSFNSIFNISELLVNAYLATDIAGRLLVHYLQNACGKSFITMDGKSKVGKGRICSELVARIPDAGTISTGNYYRYATLWATNKNISHETLLGDVYSSTQLFSEVSTLISDLEASGDISVLQSNSISSQVSSYAALPIVRELCDMLLLRAFSVSSDTVIVLEGRHLTRYLIPNSKILIHITCDKKLRVERYMIVNNLSYDESNTMLEKRDFSDENRILHPAIASDSATVVDNSGDITQTLHALREILSTFNITVK